MEIVCKNARGEQIKFDWYGPLWLKSVTGIGADFTVTTSKSNGQDGANYTGATADVRNIVIVLDVRKKDYVTQRNRLYQFFQPRAVGEIQYNDGNVSRKTGYYVESVEPSGDGVLKNITVSLLCPDPKWYDLEEQITQLATWEGLIEWPLELPPQINASGQSVTLAVDDNIDGYDKLLITGAAVQGGTGDPSPDNVRPITGTTKITVNGTDYALPQTLYSLLSGVADSFDAASGQGIKNILKLVFDGASTNLDVFSGAANAGNTIAFRTSGGTAVMGAKQLIVSDRLKTYAKDDLFVGNFEGCAISVTSATYIILRILKSRLSGWSESWTADQKVAAFKTWLAANPVTVLYPLAAPTAISGTAQAVPIYHPTTMLELDAGSMAVRCTGKFEVTRKVNTLIGNVYNGSNVTQGLTIKFMATGEVVNPSLYNIDRQELMKLNLTMHSGDVVTITTGTGNKRVKLTSGGVIANINNYMAYPPVWLQAYPGDNLYRYDAESGIDSLNVSIIHTQAYWGV